MKAESIMRFLSRIGLAPSLEKIAALARKPTGFLGRAMAKGMNQSNASLYQFVLSLMKEQNPQQALEIGFGNGRTFSDVAVALPDAKLYGLDFSQDMVRQAKANNTSLISAKKLEVQLGSSDNMPFADGQMDAIYCINVMYFWDDTPAHLHEVYRVLRPSGAFYPVIRTKESLEALPFTQYGFLIKEEAEWVALLKHAGFAEVESIAFTEPEIQFGGQPRRFTSLCLKATKSSLFPGDS